MRNLLLKCKDDGVAPLLELKILISKYGEDLLKDKVITKARHV